MLHLRSLHLSLVLSSTLFLGAHAHAWNSSEQLEREWQRQNPSTPAENKPAERPPAPDNSAREREERVQLEQQRHQEQRRQEQEHQRREDQHQHNAMHQRQHEQQLQQRARERDLQHRAWQQQQEAHQWRRERQQQEAWEWRQEQRLREQEAAARAWRYEQDARRWREEQAEREWAQHHRPAVHEVIREVPRARTRRLESARSELDDLYRLQESLQEQLHEWQTQERHLNQSRYWREQSAHARNQERRSIQRAKEKIYRQLMTTRRRMGQLEQEEITFYQGNAEYLQDQTGRCYRVTWRFGERSLSPTLGSYCRRR